VIVNWSWDSGGGHILLAYGLEDADVYLMDPWYGPGVSDYAWVRRGSGHSWAWSYRLTTSSMAVHQVPRWWLGQYLLTDGWDSMALGDQDGDGAATWEEYIADTVPTNALSRLALNCELGRGAGSRWRVAWPSSSKRVYTLQSTQTLDSPGAWEDVPGFTGVTGNGADLEYEETSMAQRRFFKVNVSLPAQ
jgi:hypothetical protein